jgi:hypothetical protein
VPVRFFFLFLIAVEVVMVREEEVEGTETQEMDILGPHTNSVASSLRSVTCKWSCTDHPEYDLLPQITDD